MMSGTIQEQTAAILRRSGLRPSGPRVAIYSYLLEHRIHPGAETVYRKLLPAHPALSLTTVYNTLKRFEDAGLVTPLTIEDGELRYDVNTAFHAHFKCRVCGRIFDFFAAEFETSLPRPKPPFQVESTHLDFYGVCPECHKNQ